MPSRRFLFALAASLALHLALLGLGLPREKVRPRSTAISARLLPPATVRPQETLLKDTLAEPAQAETVASPPQPAESRGRARAVVPAGTASRHRLSEVLFYPPEAVARGLEGEVRLLLTLDGEGNIRDAQVAAGSGHRILDEAAVQAAFALGRLPDADGREVLLPVVFRLR